MSRRTAAGLLALGLLFSSHAAHAQLDCSIDSNQGLAACGDIKAGGDINIGLTDTQVRDLVDQILAGRASDSEIVAQLAGDLGVTRNAVQTFLGILGEAHVETHLLTQKFVEIAQRHLELRDRVAALITDDPTIQALIDQAQAAIGQGDYDQADTLLTQAENADLAAAHQAEQLANQALEAVKQRYLQAAATRARRGDLSLTRLRYLEAADQPKPSEPAMAA